MSEFSKDPRVIRTAMYLAATGWTVDVDHEKGIVDATIAIGRSGVTINVIDLVYAMIDTTPRKNTPRMSATMLDEVRRRPR